MQLIAYPQVIFRQAEAPTNVNSGALWLDTDTNDLFYYNGTSWDKLNIDLGFTGGAGMGDSLDILEIQAADTLEGGQGASMIRDVFSDSTGYLNTIDTGNSTATFITNAYYNYAETTDATTAPDTTASVTSKNGVKFQAQTDTTLLRVTKDATSAATKCYLLDASKSQIGDAVDFVGNVATFTANNSLTNGTSYYLVCDAAGASHNRSYDNSPPGFPYNRTNVNFTGGYDNGNDGGTCFNVANVITGATPADAIIQTEMQSLSSTPSNCQLFCWKDSTTGDASIDAEISFDNGANYQTISLDTPTEITDTGNQMILKINLNAGASNEEASCKGYGVLFW